ncbi:MAG: DNA-3-methyladenine glycosylase [Patescibacteria group bacterium]|nr:DNA-3-methyladenine glycosylase [Patescibacteria group bacterium]
MKKILTQDFFNRPTLRVAENLLGKYLVREYRGKEAAAMITEVEAYDGPHDLASHASHGKTERTKIMFGPPGRWYVYFTYGIHWLVNVVTGPEEYPAAVLIRAVDGVLGPARTTKFFKIDKRFNGKAASRQTGLWIEDRGVRIKKTQITKNPRIGVQYAGPVWAGKKYNLRLSVSVPKQE